MKTKCFILILLSCLFFTLYSCGKTKNSGEIIDETVTYELGEYDIQNTVKNNGKKDIHYLTVNIPITNTSSSMAIIPTFKINYTIQGDSFSKITRVYPHFLAPNETGNITLETNSDRDEIVFSSIEEEKIDKAMMLDIVDKNIIIEHHTGQNQSDCYDYSVLKMTTSTKKYKDYLLAKPDKSSLDVHLFIQCICLTKKQEEYYNKYQDFNDDYLFPYFLADSTDYKTIQNIEDITTIEIKLDKRVSLNDISILYLYIIC